MERDGQKVMRCNKQMAKVVSRHWQDSNLRGITPIDF